MGIPSADMFFRLKFTSDPVSVAYTGTAGRTAQLQPGGDTLMCTTNAFFKQGAVTVTATSSSNPVAAWQPVTFYVDEATASGYISAIQSSAGGTAYVMFGVS